MSGYEQVDIEAGRVNVAEYSQTEAALAELRQRYATLPDVNTDEGYAFVKAGLKEVVGYRTSLEDARKRIKAPYLEAGRIIDAEAKRITEELVALELPMKAAKKEVDDRERRMKEERIARLTQKVNEIKATPARARGKDSDEIQALLQEVGEIDTTHDFYELTTEAAKAREDALQELSEMLDQQLRYERAEEERREAEEKLQAQRAEMERQQAEIRRQQQKLAEEREAIEAQKRDQQAKERSEAREAQQDTPKSAGADTEAEPVRHHAPGPTGNKDAEPSPAAAAPKTGPRPFRMKLSDWQQAHEISDAAMDDLMAILREHDVMDQAA